MAETRRHDRAVLQVTGPAEGVRLERAYVASLARYERLTVRGPLAGYRGELLREAKKAYDRLSGRAVAVRGRTVAGLRGQVQAREEQQGPRPAEVEDAFCREVIFRLEGDLLRYTSRQELLELAGEWGIGKFRANLLMSQIVEAVRQHRLDEPTAKERRLVEPGAGVGKGRLGTRAAVAVGAVLALVVDAAVIWWLCR